jgi:hypothetical protein
MRHPSLLFLGEYTHKLPSFKNYQTKSCQYRASKVIDQDASHEQFASGGVRSSEGG